MTEAILFHKERCFERLALSGGPLGALLLKSCTFRARRRNMKTSEIIHSYAFEYINFKRGCFQKLLELKLVPNAAALHGFADQVISDVHSKHSDVTRTAAFWTELGRRLLVEQPHLIPVITASRNMSKVCSRARKSVRKEEEEEYETTDDDEPDSDEETGTCSKACNAKENNNGGAGSVSGASSEAEEFLGDFLVQEVQRLQKQNQELMLELQQVELRNSQLAEQVNFLDANLEESGPCSNSEDYDADCYPEYINDDGGELGCSEEEKRVLDGLDLDFAIYLK